MVGTVLNGDAGRPEVELFYCAHEADAEVWLMRAVCCGCAPSDAPRRGRGAVVTAQIAYRAVSDQVRWGRSPASSPWRMVVVVEAISCQLLADQNKVLEGEQAVHSADDSPEHRVRSRYGAMGASETRHSQSSACAVVPALRQQVITGDT